MMWSILILVCPLIYPIHSANIACQDIRYKYASTGSDVYNVPITPQSGESLQICPQGPTCCTPDMEHRLGQWFSSQFKEAVNNKSLEISKPFQAKATKIFEYVLELLDRSKEQFHAFFETTYGTLYTNEKKVFLEYFSDLKKYFHMGGDLAQTTDKFFNTLFKKMFKLLNQQYQLDNNFMDCAARQISHVKPFGNITEKLGSSIKRSMTAARAIWKAVKSASEISNEMKSLQPTQECMKAVQKMNFCPACQGFSELKTCSSYCINVMKGCLVFHIEMQTHWDNLLTAISVLSERLQGPFDLDKIIMSLDVKISEAIMYFQENGYAIKEKVFERCGKPNPITQISKRPRRSAVPDFMDDIIFDDNVPKEAINPAVVPPVPRPQQKDLVKARKQGFAKIVMDIKKVSENAKGFWRSLPYTMCGQPDPTIQDEYWNRNPYVKPTDNEKCWNGNSNGSYNRKIVSDGLANLLKNPELEIKTPLIEPGIVREQSNKLKKITSQIQAAHKGEDIKWWDEVYSDVEENHEQEGSGEYEGSGDINCDWRYANCDDEDYSTDPEEGSGDTGCDMEGSGDCDTTVQPPWIRNPDWVEPDNTPEEPDTPEKPHIPPVSHTPTETPPFTPFGGSGGRIIVSSCNMVLLGVFTVLLSMML